MKTHATPEEALAVLAAQGSSRITQEVLCAKCQILDDDDGSPVLGFTNGVRWYFDKDRRPVNDRGQIVKAKAPDGVRPLLGDLEAKGDMVLVEGERDWLTALSIGLTGAVCVGGSKNLTDGQKQVIAGHVARRTVIVLFDNDEPGREAARELAAHLKLADCKTVKIATIPGEGNDLSDWVETQEPGQELGALLDLLRTGETVKKSDAKKTLADKGKDFREESDEFVTPQGDPVVLIWEPDDREHPQIIGAPGRSRFVRFDRETTRASNLLAVEVMDEWAPEPPSPGDSPDATIYGPAPTPDHMQDHPAVLRPMGGDTFSKRVIILPSGAQEHGSTEALFDDICGLIDEYFVIHPEFIHAMAAYVLMTYRYLDAGFETIPYIRVVGPPGNGKTRFARVMRELCYRSVFVTGMRPVHLYRIIEYFKGGGATLVFEEIHIDDKGEDTREFMRMLNAGNQQGAFVPRMGGQHFSEISWMSMYSPKVIGMNGELFDEGMIRRCLTGYLGEIKVPAHKRMARLPDTFYIRAANLRERLLGWRFSKYALDCPEDNEAAAAAASANVEAGIWQNLYPVISMVPKARAESVAKIMSLASHSQEQLDVTRQSADPVHVVEAAIHVAVTRRDAPQRAWLSDILADLTSGDRNARWTQRTALQGLRELRLKPARSKRSDGPEIRNDWYVDLDDKFLSVAQKHKLAILDAAEAKQRADQTKAIL